MVLEKLVHDYGRVEVKEIDVDKVSMTTACRDVNIHHKNKILSGPKNRSTPLKREPRKGTPTRRVCYNWS
jgi:hypothetical protein